MESYDKCLDMRRDASWSDVDWTDLSAAQNVKKGTKQEKDRATDITDTDVFGYVDDGEKEEDNEISKGGDEKTENKDAQTSWEDQIDIVPHRAILSAWSALKINFSDLDDEKGNDYFKELNLSSFD